MCALGPSPFSQLTIPHTQTQHQKYTQGQPRLYLSATAGDALLGAFHLRVENDPKYYQWAPYKSTTEAGEGAAASVGIYR